MEFWVNGIKADVDDFGEMEDVDRASAEPYGCGNMIFVKDEEPKEKVLERYGITIGEWQEICEHLEVVLCVGKCGWCI